MFSTLEDGKIVEGLAGVPNEGPVLLVGYPILMGLELYSLVKAISSRLVTLTKRIKFDYFEHFFSSNRLATITFSLQHWTVNSQHWLFTVHLFMNFLLIFSLSLSLPLPLPLYHLIKEND